MRKIDVTATKKAFIADETEVLEAVRKYAKERSEGVATNDSFTNFAAKLGLGTDNLSSGSSYGFNPISRQRVLLEWIHRGSWLGGMAVDIVAKDMTRAGVDIKGPLKPDQIDAINEETNTYGVWNSLNDVIKWSRLYGGCIGVLLIEGQNPSTPLVMERVGKGQFRGILPLDMWMLQPSFNDMVSDLGPWLGTPKYYDVLTNAPAFIGKRIHYTRIIRMIGIKTPYQQSLIDNLWGTSVIERLYDRMVAYDSATTGAAQLVHKAYIRTYKVDGLRDIISMGGPSEQGLLKYTDMIRRFQSIEGMTLMDKEDEFEGTEHNAFGGLDTIIHQLAQQLSGAMQIPLVRLLGQSPAGLSSTGEGDLKTYYDGINSEQNATLLVPVTKVYRLVAQSCGIKIPKGFSVSFRPLWQTSEKERAEIASLTTATVVQAAEAGLITQQIAMKELRQSSNVTGIWSNITDEDIEAAEMELPPGPAEKADTAQSNIEESTAAPKGGMGSVSSKKKGKTSEPMQDGVLARLKNKLAAWYKDIEQLSINSAQWRAIGAENQTHDGRTDAARDMEVLHGLNIVIENPRGTIRRGVNFEVEMPADYGYLRRTTGADGDQVDCYIGDSPDSDQVYVIAQNDLRTGEFDEHKCMLGFASKDEAVATYVLGYTDGTGPKRLRSVETMSMGAFKEWLASDNVYTL